MKKDVFLKLYRDRGIDEAIAQSALMVVSNLEKDFEEQGVCFETVDVDFIKSYIAQMVAKEENTLESFLALARYFHMINRKDIYIYFTKLLGGRGVIENIKDRMIQRVGHETTDRVFSDLIVPPLGTPIEDVPIFTKVLMEKIESELAPEDFKQVLAGNNHRIPVESMALEKEFYQNSSSLETYLKERHDRKVAELQSYCDRDAVWFEQVITQEVVDFVRANQEILSAVKKDNQLYVTKIPFDTVPFLNAENDMYKNYYACHCPFAREAILNEDQSISKNWCYCSGGFAKFPFEQILGRELTVELLESALDGDGRCRFIIDLSK